MVWERDENYELLCLTMTTTTCKYLKLIELLVDGLDIRPRLILNDVRLCVRCRV